MRQGLIQALPPMLVIRPAPHDQAHDVVSLISPELSQPTPGQQTVLDATARRTSRHGYARVFRTELNCATLVSRSFGTAARPRPPSDAQLAGACLDGNGACKPQPDVSSVVCPQLRACARPVTDAVPHRLAVNAGSRLPARRRTHLGTDRLSHRVQLTQCFLSDISPTRWISTWPVAAAALVEAVDSNLRRLKASRTRAAPRMSAIAPGPEGNGRTVEMPRKSNLTNSGPPSVAL